MDQNCHQDGLCSWQSCGLSYKRTLRADSEPLQLISVWRQLEVSAEAKPEHRHKGQGVQTPWYSPEAVCAARGNLPPSPTSKTHESGGESLVSLVRPGAQCWCLSDPELSHACALHRLNFADLIEACCAYSSFCTWRNCTVRGARN